MSVTPFVVLGAVLFSLGLYGVVTRRSGVMVLLAVELMLNAVNINFVAFGALHATSSGQVFSLFVIAIAAAEVAVGLAIVLLIYRNKKTTEFDAVDEMKG